MPSRSTQRAQSLARGFGKLLGVAYFLSQHDHESYEFMTERSLLFSNNNIHIDLEVESEKRELAKRICPLFTKIQTRRRSVQHLLFLDKSINHPCIHLFGHHTLLYFTSIWYLR